VKLLHRELEGSLLALQILLAHADLAVRHDESNGEIAISPRRVLIEIRREMAGPRARPNQRSTYLQRLNNCRAATRQQRGLKATRDPSSTVIWPFEGRNRGFSRVLSMSVRTRIENLVPRIDHIFYIYPFFTGYCYF
jgi:hypothetical protein